MTLPKNITILGRRWFERVNGNTYHSVKVYVDGVLVGAVPFQYGYGDQYMQSASSILVNNCEFIPKGLEDKFILWRWCKEKGVELISDVADVGRKKDL